MKAPAKPVSKNDDPFDGDDSHCMIGYGYAGIAPPRVEGGTKAAKPPRRAAPRAGNGKVVTPAKAPAPIDSKDEDIFDLDDRNCTIGHKYLGLLRRAPRRAATKRGKKAATVR